jgi:hypothetical protein
MIGMKGLKFILVTILIFAGSSLFAQPQSLPEFYASLSFSHQANNSDLRTTVYQPLTATNYIWGGSAWNFTDTTLYVYTATNKTASLTKKDNANNFISRILNSYDTANNLIDALHQDWSSGWANNFRDTFAFDSYNSLTLQENHQWNTNQWVRAGGYRYFYTYNGGGKVLSKITVSWNTSTLVWDTISRISNTYNANNQVTQTIGESYNSATNSWQLNSKRDYTYDASFINTQTTDYTWSGQWDNNTRIINIVWSTWTGDVNTSDPQSYIYQLWSGTWNNYNRLTYNYDAFGSTIQLTEFFASGNWRNDSRLSDFYDNQYNYTGTRSESWNVLSAAWDTLYEYKYIHTYDANNSIIETVYQQYDVLNHVFVNSSRTVYSDFVLMGVEDIAATNSTVRIYPNPVTDFADVAMPAEMQGAFTYRIYDSTGKLIGAGVEKSNFRIVRAGLAEGLYLLCITGRQGANYILKFVVQ